MGVEVIPGLEGWYLPVLLLIEVLVFNEQVACLDPAFDLSFHDFVVWLGLVPCSNHSERVLELIDVFDGVSGWGVLLYSGLHSRRELDVSWFGLPPVWWYIFGSLRFGEEGV